MVIFNLILLGFSMVFITLVIGFLSRTKLVHALKKGWRFLEDRCYAYQLYRVPKFNENLQENQLYRKVHAYLNSLPFVEDSALANLFASSKSAEINLVLDENQVVVDGFLGARVRWSFENSAADKSLVLRIRKIDKRRILVPYLQHIHQVFDEIEQKRKEVRLFVNVEAASPRCGGGRRWISAPFTHPATMETIAMDSDLKARIKSDLESFLKGRQHYHRLGRVWKRSYLLYGPAGTGKSTFVSAMARFLNYDIYEINLHKIASDSDLDLLLLQTTNKSLLVIEDLDRFLADKPATVSPSGILNFMDGIFSGCGEERVMVFTMNSKDSVDPSILRPGRIDVHIHFPLCDFAAFKTLASSHLGLKDHKLFTQVQEIFQTGASLSPAEICEIMISNRSSPSRALKTVITALQTELSSRVGRRVNVPGSGRVSGELGDPGMFSREGQSGGGGMHIHPIKEIKNLYGFLRARSNSRKSSMDKLDVDVSEG